MNLAKGVATLQELSGGRFALGVAGDLGRRQLRPGDPACARAGDVWHPSRGSSADHVRRVKEKHLELRVIPRTSPERLAAMPEAGVDRAIVSFRDEAGMRDFARRYR
jgi:alkanesulfonate monooxygenase SsuD/methylene tetrahydromethanopterin reductase-like flavin-dependent oxidoreductase (luciferase family)